MSCVCRRLLTTVDILKYHNLNLADNLNIPESGDGVPDLLNEAKWEIDWLIKMQKEDGGVFNKLASELWESGPPATSDLGGRIVRYFLSRTTHDTATVGAVFALASRVWAPYNQEYAQQLLAKALLSYSFLQLYPTAVPATGFENPPGQLFCVYYMLYYC
jgi:endoglucanase